VPFFTHGFVLLFMLAFWVVVIVGAVWLVLWAIRVAPRRFRPDNALSILNEHFARGEIDQLEYDTRKAALLRH
jgi:putative membrane protein